MESMESISTLAMTFQKELTSEGDKMLFRLAFLSIVRHSFLLTVQVCSIGTGAYYKVIPNNTCARTWGQRGVRAYFQRGLFSGGCSIYKATVVFSDIACSLHVHVDCHRT